MEIERIVLPLAALFFFGFGLVLPVVRHWRRTGTTGIAVASSKDRRQRVIGLVLATILLGLGALAAAVATFGSEPLGVRRFHTIVHALGWTSLAAGVVVIMVAQAQMGRSWRIGIDAAPTELVTAGLYARVRHPIYSAMFLALGGLVLAVPCVWSLVLLALAVVGISVETRWEEQHLTRIHGERYRSYQDKTGRFVPRFL